MCGNIVCSGNINVFSINTSCVTDSYLCLVCSLTHFSGETVLKK